jgi:hypothetical protein
MPVYPVVWGPFERTGHYPHMSKHDSRIWERFQARYAGYFQEAAYDIALGGSLPTDPQATEAERLGWQFNTAKRIDAAVRNPDEIWLCEVRRGSGTDAIGAVIVYGELSELDKWADRPLILTIVTDRIDPDLRRVAEILEIQVIELPEPPIGDELRRG